MAGALYSDLAGIAAVVIGDNRLGFFIRIVETFRVALFCFIQPVKD